jgi:hypothetical protein
MYAKAYEAKGEIVVAVCDKELIGRVLREGDLVLDLKAHSKFYVGELVSEERACEMLKSATSINLVGKRAVGLALKSGLAKKGDEKTVGGVPHLQVYELKP